LQIQKKHDGRDFKNRKTFPKEHFFSGGKQMWIPLNPTKQKKGLLIPNAIFFSIERPIGEEPRN
jgi:hypothetical protein